MISFDAIPNDVRTPLTFIEFNNSNAVTGTPAPRQRVLMFGQCAMTADNQPVGTAAIDTPVRITSPTQAISAFGQGSMLALMVKAFQPINRGAELYCIAQGAGEGSNLAATISLSGTATGSGVLVTYIGGTRLPVGVLADDSGVDVARQLVDLINGTPDLTVRATLLDAVEGQTDETLASIQLDAKFTGRGSVTDVRWNYYAQEVTPAGINAAVAYPQDFATNPDISLAIANAGEKQYPYIVMPYLDEPNLNALRTELQERWGPVNQADGFAVAAFKGELGEITNFGISRNDHLITCLGVPSVPQPDYHWASVVCAIAAQSLNIDPARPLQTLTLPGLMPPPEASRFLWEERNALLYDGISTFTVDDGDQVQLERLITMYRTNAYGDADPSYLDVNTIATLSYLRYSTRLRIQQKFPRHKLAEDGTPIAPGQAIVTPAIIKTELLALFTEWELAGLVEDFTTFKDELIVERNANDRNRIDVLAGPNLINQFRIFAEQIRFIL